MEIALLDIVTVAGLLLVGVILIVVELFLLPGISAAGIAATVAFGASVYYAFSLFGTTVGYLVLLLALLLSIAAVVWVMRSNALDRMALDTTVDGVVPTTIDHTVQVGDKGVTLTRLNPMGNITLHGKSVEAKVVVGFLDEGTPIVVERIERNTIVVKAISQKP